MELTDRHRNWSVPNLTETLVRPGNEAPGTTRGFFYFANREVAGVKEHSLKDRAPLFDRRSLRDH
jgi:hypothetical protein